ncbi:MAG: CmpA/NrtA family ABC transporter substrate-binding protein [Pseudomonadota bacterium]
MSEARLGVGFIPLVDSAPLIVAQEMGFAAEEGLAFDLVRAPSWSSLRDMLSFGQVDAAHLLSPVPVATALGLGGAATPLEAISVLSVNGTVIGVNNALASRLRAGGHDFDFADATKAGRAVIAAAEGTLRIGVPFPFSMHAELLYYWLSSLGLPAPQSLDIRTVPPPLMAEAIKAGDIDAFCVGEPWGSIAVENGVGTLLLPGNAIWQFAPEKVLGVRADWAQREGMLCARLIRAVWRAGRWLAEPSSHTLAAQILGKSNHLDMPPEVIDRALSGRLTISPQGEQRQVDGFMEFHTGQATFPWRSQAAWIGHQLASRTGLDRQEATARVQSVFRTDLYRQALRGLGAELPRHSSKLEGGLTVPTEAPAESGHLILAPNAFFDDRVFDPETSS